MCPPQPLTTSSNFFAGTLAIMPLKSRTCHFEAEESHATSVASVPLYCCPLDTSKPSMRTRAPTASSPTETGARQSSGTYARAPLPNTTNHLLAFSLRSILHTLPLNFAAAPDFRPKTCACTPGASDVPDRETSSASLSSQDDSPADSSSVAVVSPPAPSPSRAAMPLNFSSSSARAMGSASATAAVSSPSRSSSAPAACSRLSSSPPSALELLGGGRDVDGSSKDDIAVSCAVVSLARCATPVSLPAGGGAALAGDAAVPMSAAAASFGSWKLPVAGSQSSFAPGSFRATDCTMIFSICKCTRFVVWYLWCFGHVICAA
mmetsp:Transcript_94016/g.265493  ORF Transcript_94016/g.265493 Transcript_94016/m.265493 type:complete len:320 (+) Transcript_94016:144-1103(+)